MSKRMMATVKFQENATRIRQILAGMCVNTIVLTRPKRFPRRAATGYENAASTLDQKKKALAAPSDRLNRSNSHSANSDWTTKPLANASRLNRAASLYTVERDVPNPLDSGTDSCALL